MNNFLLFLVAFVGLPNLLNAQIDQVSVGANYTHQAYYKIATGEVTQVSNTAWDLAFSNLGLQDGAIFVNESASYDGRPIYLFPAPTNNWSDVISDTAPYVDTLSIFNPEKSWTEGAFNVWRDTTSVFDYGWGTYNSSNHQVEGTKVFVLKLRDASFLKIQIISLTAGTYNFRIANLDGSNERSFSLTKDEAKGPFLYFTFTSEEEVEMPSDYDLIFTRYNTPLDAGDSFFINYSVTGVLLAPGTEAVVAHDVNPVVVDFEAYEDQLSDRPNTIGHDWKYFDFSSGWVVVDNSAQFVKTKKGDVYKIIFYDFEGSSTGITTLEKFLVKVSGSSKFALDELGVKIYPNPSSNYIRLEQLELPAACFLFNAQGQIVLQSVLDAEQNELDLEPFEAGRYQLVLKLGSKYYSEQILIQK